MFAYCNNNPVNRSDPDGDNPILLAAAGGAVAGAAISLFHYYNTAGADATFKDALIAGAGGAISGALGGAAGMLSGTTQIVTAVGAGIVAGVFSEATGGDFLIGGIFGTIGAFLGTKIDISMFKGMELFFASLVASLGVGWPIELASQSVQKDVQPYLGQSTQKHNNTQPSSGGGRNGAIFTVVSIH